MQSEIHKCCREAAKFLLTKATQAFVALVLIAGLIAAQNCSAQTDLGTITGTVRDSSGANIANGQVEIRNAKTSAVRTTTSDSNGFFTVPSLTVGPYTVTAKAEGFGVAVSNVELTTSGATANFQLAVGGLQQQVNVSAAEVTVAPQTDSQEISTTVSPTQLVNLPNNGRSILSVATLGPASQPGTDVGVDVGDTGFYGQQSASVIIAGLGNAHASFLQDGVANTNLLTQTANILASVEGLRKRRHSSTERLRVSASLP